MTLIMMMMMNYDDDDDDDDDDDALVHRSQAGCFPSGCTEEQGRIPGEWLSLVRAVVSTSPHLSHLSVFSGPCLSTRTVVVLFCRGHL
jgi:hypothetical protein